MSLLNQVKKAAEVHFSKPNVDFGKIRRISEIINNFDKASNSELEELRTFISENTPVMANITQISDDITKRFRKILPIKVSENRFRRAKGISFNSKSRVKTLLLNI